MRSSLLLSDVERTTWLLSSTYLGVVFLIAASLFVSIACRPLRLDLGSGRSLRALSRIGGLSIAVVSLQAFLAFFDDPTQSLPARPASVDLARAIYLAGLATVMGVFVLVPGLLLLRATRAWKDGLEVRNESSGLRLRLTLVLLALAAGLTLTLWGVRPIPGSSLVKELMGPDVSSVRFAFRGSLAFRVCVLLGGLLLLFSLYNLLVRSHLGQLVFQLGLGAMTGLSLVASVEAYFRVYSFHELPDRYLAISLGSAATVLLATAYLALGAMALGWVAEARRRRQLEGDSESQ